MQFLPIEGITVAPRFRQQFAEKPLEDLCNSILENGLLHAPVVHVDDKGAYLLAGERRLRAMSKLHEQGKPFRYGSSDVPIGMTPVTSMTEVTELKAKQIEVDENEIREDLTWQERAQATAALHELRTMQNPKQTMKDTATELGAPTNSTKVVRDKLLLADNLHRPEVAKAQTEADALKALRVSLLRDFEIALGRAPAPASDKQKDLKVMNGDCKLVLPEMPAGIVDVWLTDPPYGVGADGWGQGSTPEGGAQIKHLYEDDWGAIKPFHEMLSRQMFRISKPMAHLYLFCDIVRFEELKAIFSADGWKVWTRPLIWVRTPGLWPDSRFGPQRAYECILYAIKGDKPVMVNRTDVIQIPSEPNKVHAAQKPPALYVELLKRSCSTREFVVDPCCGSGTIFAAARECNLRALGIELDPQMFAYSQERINKI